MFKKTVYILGAGASKTANLPTQAEILPLIFSIRTNENERKLSRDNFLSLELDDMSERIIDFYSDFDDDRKRLGEFIIDNFSLEDKINQYRVAIEHANCLPKAGLEQVDLQNDFLFRAYDVAKSVNVTLEDLFTIFDNVTAGREHFRLYSPEKMEEIHNKLKRCIIYALVYSISNGSNDSTYKKFSQLLLNIRLATKQKEDRLAVITMNWDDILERTLYSLCNKYNSGLKKGQQRQRVFLDLCFYNHSLSANEKHVPSTHIKARGQKNIKILKMHGSLGWLECPKCGRIYTDFSQEIAAYDGSDLLCPKCKDVNVLVGENPKLRSMIITPTFMKSLGNLNIKTIWHNAFINISEADRLVFIGYSFPDADFEMRCLLKKSVKKDALITIILNNLDNPHDYKDRFINKGYSEKESALLVKKMRLPEERYKSFFGEDRMEISYKGFEEYLNKNGGSVNG